MNPREYRGALFLDRDDVRLAAELRRQLRGRARLHFRDFRVQVVDELRRRHHLVEEIVLDRHNRVGAERIGMRQSAHPILGLRVTGREQHDDGKKNAESAHRTFANEEKLEI